jgi:hypothetical protein
MKTAGRLLLDSLRFAGRHAASLLIIAGLLLIPAGLIKAAGPTLAAWAGLPEDLRTGALGSVGAFVISVIRSAVVILTGNAIVLFVARDRVGQPIGWRAAWRLGLGRARPAITGTVAALLMQTGYIVLIGLVAVFLQRQASGSFVGQAAYQVVAFGAAVFISLRVMLVAPVAAIERIGGFEAYHRNRDLLRGHDKIALLVLIPIELINQGFSVALAAIPSGPTAGTLRDLALTLLNVVVSTVAATVLYLWLRDQTAPLRPDEVGVPAAVVPPTAEVTT